MGASLGNGIEAATAVKVGDNQGNGNAGAAIAIGG